MSPKVVDASVALKWVLPEEYSAQAIQLLERGLELMAPPLITVEVAHNLIKRVRRKQLSAAQAERALAQIEGQVDLTDVANLWRSPYAAAVMHQISAYDACYVALAKQLECELITADRRLYNALAPSTAVIAVWIGDIDELTSDD